jgi:WD40 repeat protein
VQGSGQLRVWDSGTGQTQARAGLGKSDFVFVQALSFSNDGRILAFAPNDGPITLWDPKTGSRLNTLPEGRQCRALVWSPDGAGLIAATSEYKGSNLWDWEHAAVRSVFNVSSAAFSPDGAWLGSHDGVYSATTGERKVGFRRANVGRGRDDPWEEIPYWVDQNTLALVQSSGVIRLWDRTTGEPCGCMLVGPSGERSVTIGREGLCSGVGNFEPLLVYVVQTDTGQQTLTPAEFAVKYSLHK